MTGIEDRDDDDATLAGADEEAEEEMEAVETTETGRQRDTHTMVVRRRRGASDPNAATAQIERPTGMVERPKLALETPSPTVDSFQWWQTSWLKAGLCIVFGFVLGATAMFLFTDSHSVEPVEVKPIRSGLVTIALTPEAGVLIPSATTTPKLDEIQSAASLTFRCDYPEEEVAAELEIVPIPNGKNGKSAGPTTRPVRRPGPQLRKVMPPGEPTRASEPPCRGRSGQDRDRCCQTMTERLDDYVGEFTKCTGDPNNWLPAATGDQ